ncbi:MAG TPA: DUF11 domain-containing protein [Thermoanaerobaculia bacterium]
MNVRRALLLVVLSLFAANAAYAQSDVSVTKTDNVDPINAGQNFFYTVSVTNNGPDPASTVSWSDPLPAGTTFVSLSQPGGWTCVTPAVGANGTVTCSIASLPVATANFNITVASNAGLTAGTVLSNTVTVTSAGPDPNPANNTDTETTNVNTSADLQLSKTDAPDPVDAGGNLSYAIVLTNNGPSNADATFTDTLPAGTTFVSLSTSGPWTCTTPAVGSPGTVTCTNSSYLVTADFFTLVVRVDPTVAAGTVLTNTATLSATTPDPNLVNNAATTTTTVTASADLLLSKTDSPDPVIAGDNLSYQITITNAGPSNAAAASFTDTLPAGTTFVSLSTTGPWTCVTPPVGTTGTVTCTNPSFFPTVEFFTLVVNVDPSVPAGTVLTNTATMASTTPDPNSANNSATTTTTVAAPPAGADVSGTKGVSGAFIPGSAVTYTVVLTNNGAGAQGDNPGNEFLDVLPPQLTLVSATATSGTAVATVGTNTVTWNGAIAAGGTVTITINATVRPDATPGATVSNQGTINYDGDGNGTNEATRQTDAATSPGGATDPTTFIVGAAAAAAIPTLDEAALMALAVLLAAVAAFVLKR